MADLDDAECRLTRESMQRGVRRVSGMVSRPTATPGQWAELAEAAEALAAIAARIETESGDRDVRRIRDGAYAVSEIAKERSEDEA